MFQTKCRRTRWNIRKKGVKRGKGGRQGCHQRGFEKEEEEEKEGRKKEKTTHIGKVGNAAANKQHLAVGPDRRAQHQLEHRVRVVVRLHLRRRARVLAVVGQLAGEARRRNRVGVHDRRAAARHERPDASGRVQHRQLQRRARLGVEFGNVRLLLAQLAPKRRRELHGRARVNVHLTAATATATAVASLLLLLLRCAG